MERTAIIYTRVSSTGERQNVERQVADLAKYASTHGLNVVKTFNEKISGAKRNAERTVLNDALSFAKNNEVSIILFSELSRLGRNVLEVQEVIKWMADNNVNAYFQKEGLLLLDENGKIAPTTVILISCLGMVAEIERENIKFRLNSGREHAKEKGVKMGRKVGYRMTLEDFEKKYPIAIRHLRKGERICDVYDICRSRGEKVGLSTLSTLKKMVTKDEK